MSSAQVIENWTDVTGTIENVRAAADRHGFKIAEVSIASTSKVQGYADLIGDSQPEKLDILIPTEIVARSGIEAGRKASIRVRRGSNRSVFAHPDHCRTE